SGNTKALFIPANETTSENNSPAISANVYPNPSNGQFTLKATGKDGEPIQVIIYNSTGAQVYSTKGTGKLSQIVNLKVAYTGMGQYFFARITIGGKTFIKKIIIAKQ
ncbi:MAG: T9SS type A sorting domain-containing protein, partial [Mucilaginibacter sp.]